MPKKQSKNTVQVKIDGSKPKKTNGIDLGERGIYDRRNTLNDLTGREWAFFTLSVMETKYPTSGKSSIAHDLRKVHPSPKPPQLMAAFINFFSKKNGWVFDPFAGVGGTLIGCSLTGRNGIGLEISNRFAKIYNNVCIREKINPQKMIVDDARNMDNYEEITSREFDLILTDPPYANMIARKKTAEGKEKGKFTNQENDIGNLPYPKFLVELKRILDKSTNYLKNKGYLVVFCKDFQPKKHHHNMLHCDITNELVQISNITFKGYRIWYDKTLSPYPFGYPYAFVATQIHQFALIFRKEKKS